MAINQSEEQNPPSLKEVISRNRIPFAISIAIAGAVSVGLEWRKPIVYKATAVLLMAQNDQPSGASAASVLAGAAADPIRILAGVLESQRARGIVGEAIGVESKALAFTVRADPISSQLTINTTGATRDRAIDTAREMIVALRKIEKEVGFTTADGEAANIKAALATRVGDLRTIEGKITEFFKGAHTAPDPEKPGTALAYLRELNAAKIELNGVTVRLDALKDSTGRVAAASGNLPIDGNLDLAAARKILTEATYRLNLLLISKNLKSPDVVRARQEMQVAKKAFEEQVAKAMTFAAEGLSRDVLELSSRKLVLESQIAFLEPLAKEGPKESVQYMRLFADYTRASANLTAATVRYEAVRLRADAARVRWSVLDQPSGEPAAKGYFSSLFVGLVGGAFLGLLVVILLERFRKTQQQ